MSAEDEILAVVKERVAAVQAKDVKTLTDRQAASIVTFDILPPLSARGRDAVDAKTQAWFDGYASDIGYDVQQLEIHAAGNVAFCSFVYNVRGTLASGDDVDMWCRATLGLRRYGEHWQIVHDHESIPWDPETGQGVTDAAPGDN